MEDTSDTDVQQVFQMFEKGTCIPQVDDLQNSEHGVNERAPVVAAVAPSVVVQQQGENDNMSNLSDELEELRQERNVLQCVLGLVQNSVSTLLPLIQTAVSPSFFSSSRLESQAQSLVPSSYPSVSIREVSNAYGGDPLPFRSLTTPSNPSQKPCAGHSTVDSGLAISERGSGERGSLNEEVTAREKSSVHDGSVLMSLRPTQSMQPNSSLSPSLVTPPHIDLLSDGVSMTSSLLAPLEKLQDNAVTPIKEPNTSQLIRDLSILSSDSTMLTNEVCPCSDTLMLLAPLSAPADADQPPIDLSIYNLDSSFAFLGHQAVRLDDSDIVMQSVATQSAQGISVLHDSVLHLLQSFITAAIQASEYCARLGQLQRELAFSQSRLTEQLGQNELLHYQMENLQHQLKEQYHCQRLCDEREQAAQEKIRRLVKQVEMQQKEADCSEMVVSVEEECKETKQANSALLAIHQLLLKQEHDNYIQGDQEQQVSAGVMEEDQQAKRKVFLEVSQHCATLRETNRILQKSRESMEVELRKEIEEKSTRVAQLESILQAKNHQLKDLEDLPSQLLVREKAEEKIKKELNESQSQLAAVQHEVALLTSHLSVNEQQNNGEARLVEESRIHLLDQVKSLQVILQQKEATLKSIVLENNDHSHRLQQQMVTLETQVKDLYSEVQCSKARINELCSVIEHKEQEMVKQVELTDSLQARLAKVDAESRKVLLAYEQAVVQIHTFEVEKAASVAALKEKEQEREELLVTNAQLELKISSLSLDLAEKEEYRILQIQSLEQSLKQAHQQLTDKCHEVRLLSNKLACSESWKQPPQVHKPSGTKEGGNWEQNVDSNDQKRNIEADLLEALREQLIGEKNEALLGAVKQHERTLNKLRKQLKAEHAGELALMAAHYREQVEHTCQSMPPSCLGMVLVDEVQLQEIVMKVPQLESDAHDVRGLSVETGEMLTAEDEKHYLTYKDLQTKLPEKDRQEHVEDLQASTVEESVKKANSTIAQLKEELQARSSREASLINSLDNRDKQMCQKLQELQHSLTVSISAEKLIASGLQELLQKERKCNVELNAALATSLARNKTLSENVVDLRSQLCEAQAKLGEIEASRLVLEEALCDAQEQLAAANMEATTANAALEYNLEKAKQLQSYMLSQEATASDKRSTSWQKLEPDQQAAINLQNALHRKEAELTKFLHQYLQENIALANAREKIAALEHQLANTNENFAVFHNQEGHRKVVTLPTEKAELQANVQRLEGQLGTQLHKKTVLGGCQSADQLSYSFNGQRTASSIKEDYLTKRKNQYIMAFHNEVVPNAPWQNWWPYTTLEVHNTCTPDTVHSVSRYSAMQKD